METSLHNTLKHIYAGADGQSEVKLDSFRIDAVCNNELVEIQHGSLSAIRRKTRQLLDQGYSLRIVKPLIVRKKLIKRQAKGKKVVSRRMSPMRGNILELFNELVYFRDIFPHPNLILEVPLVWIEEWRYPTKSRRRRNRKPFTVEDQRLLDIQATEVFKTSIDLLRTIPADLEEPFETKHLADAMQIDRWFAQRIAYCLRNAKAILPAGKHRNAMLYKYCA